MHVAPSLEQYAQCRVVGGGHYGFRQGRASHYGSWGIFFLGLWPCGVADAVSLSRVGLLFQSGSATVDKRGKEALGKLAEVLNKQANVDVYIEGHTDTKPIHTARFADNWDLSVIRATSVVRILTKEYGVSPMQIVPSGRGEYLPVADNETTEGRSKNRRTEIIIAPKLDELLKILN